MDSVVQQEVQAANSPSSDDFRLPYSYARRHSVVVDKQNGELIAFCSAKTRHTSLLEVTRLFASHIKFREVDEGDFNAELSRIYQQGGESRESMEGIGEDMDLASLADSVAETEDLLDDDGEDRPIIRLINGIMVDAVNRNVSDIHIETFEKRLIVRFRIDGVLQEVLEPRRALAPLLVSRIKVMAKLDIAEKRIPQDGRISRSIGGREVDVRVSTLPSSHGERVVMRLLDKQAGRLNLGQLGIEESNLQRLQRIIDKPHGILLVTGPTGSGKTTTLYASLSQLNDSSRNILTVEDPIEYTLPGIGQTQVNTKADMTFARGLRAILRQDPDVVMIGEIRDLETVEIAVQASLTGHLVLSTLHTNTAVGAMTRLHDMGVEPFLLASSLVGVVAQRLVRVLCPHCRQPYEADEAEKALYDLKPTDTLTLYHAVGCTQCGNTGYRGRMGIHEVIEIDDHLRSLIHANASELEMEKYARQSSKSIRADGLAKVRQGKTTLEEVYRVSKG
ncbi:MAG: type II secretion system ATPase GspE [Oceanospirillaceae bacterium]|nr:type II secretion system ATPase GspE [Oceanospirillaceae bacterium]MCP5349380.1 type II secretion system ATPase GspE [Oceanospirillaceae bacterium]